MSDFLQLHLLTVYAPSNLNRDDTGRPKSAVFGGVPRLRVSSQSLKRAWRQSDVFAGQLDERLGKRTQRLGGDLLQYLRERGMDDTRALDTARLIAGVFGKIKSEKTTNESERTFIEQLAFISPAERERALSLADRALAGENIAPQAEDLLLRADSAADIAMFGRMLAEDPAFNREAAVQVAHAITTHRAVVEDDYYTALDDLKSRDDPEDAGAGFLGVQEFGAGVFYLYVCIDRGQLLSNLGGDEETFRASQAALVEAAATVSPRGKQASFASRAHASYVLAEKGAGPTRSLAAAFLKPVQGEDIGQASVEALERLRDRMDDAYGADSVERCSMDVQAGHGTLRDIVAFAVE